MTSRNRLLRSIPFWVLLAGSLALTAVGAWLVLDRLGRIESAIIEQTPQATIEVYVGQPAVLAGAVILGAGLVGLLLTLAIAALRSLVPDDGDAVVESVEWTEEPSGFAADAFPPAGAAAPAAPATTVPAAPETTTATASAADATPPAPAATHADPVIAEDPDVETPSDQTPPPAARP